jgi:hypothetical protein
MTLPSDPPPSSALPPTQGGPGVTASFYQSDGTNLTDPLKPAPTAAPASALPSVPGYVIEGVLGVGGMGIVYKAMHLALKRTVALKMMLVGRHALTEQADRFRSEAEAVARLQHANIVQIHEVGQHDGLPFFALEFVPGGSLARKLDGRPLPPAEAARLVEALAQGVHLAHSRGIVHRDLKPGNVLLAEDGTPKISDFGLAKKLDEDSGKTQAGQVLGTPSYMAPEQAEGRTWRVGTAADVWALGAILYECLTGRPPFRGETPLETLEQVRTQEPQPPRVSNPAVPRDLEVICLKCLHKEPEKRYASAQELADDLGRYLRGEPIEARPVGRLERLGMWARRRPGIAILLTAVVVVFVAGATVSTWFGLLARQAAREATENANKANAALDQVELTLARSLGRPLGFQVGIIINQGELDALWNLSSSPSERVRILVFEEALATPEAAVRLSRRVEVALHAGVGLVPARRDRLRELLLCRLEEPDQDRRIREACVYLGMALPIAEERFARPALETLREGIARTQKPFLLDRHVRTLAVLAGHLGPEDAMTAAEAVLDAAGKFPDPGALAGVPETLVALAPRLAAADADRTLVRVRGLLARTTVPVTAVGLMQAAAALSTHLPEPEARSIQVAALRRCYQVLNVAASPGTMNGLHSLATQLAPSLGPEDAGAVVIDLIEAAAHHQNAAVLAGLVPTAAVLAGRLDAVEAEKAARRLLDLLARTSQDRNAEVLVGVLATLAGRLNRADLPALLTLASGPLDRDGPTGLLINAVRAIAALVPADPTIAAPVLEKGIERCLKTLAERFHTDWTNRLGRTVEETAPRLDQAQAAAAVQHVLRSLQTITYPATASSLARVVAALTPRLDGAQANQAQADALAALEKATQLNQVSGLARCVAALASRQAPAEAARCSQLAARRVLELLPRTADLAALSGLTDALVGLAPHLRPEDAAAAAEVVVQDMPRHAQGELRGNLGKATAALAGRLKADPAGRIGDAAAGHIVAGLLSALSAAPPDSLFVALEAMAPFLTPEEAGKRLRDVLTAVARTGSQPAQKALLRAVGFLTPRLSPDEARACGDHAFSLLNRPGCLGWLGEIIGSLAAKMRPEDAAAITGTVGRCLVAAAVGKTPGLAMADRQRAAEGAAFLAPYLAPAAVVELLREVFDLLARSPGVESSKELLATALLARMGPGEAASSIAPAAVRALDTLTAQGERATLTEYLAALARCSTLPGLVELLKQPTCVGQGRRIILAELGKRAGRSFADVWDFVSWAREQQPNLDLTTPPLRPPTRPGPDEPE